MEPAWRALGAAHWMVLHTAVAWSASPFVAPVLGTLGTLRSQSHLAAVSSNYVLAPIGHQRVSPVQVQHVCTEARCFSAGSRARYGGVATVSYEFRRACVTRALACVCKHSNAQAVQQECPTV